MADFLYADLRHYLDEHGQIPEDLPAPARRLAQYLASIVEEATQSSETHYITDLSCRRRPKRKPCGGEVFTTRTEGRIEWTCPLCEDGGIIIGWEGTQWGRRGRVTALIATIDC